MYSSTHCLFFVVVLLSININIVIKNKYKQNGSVGSEWGREFCSYQPSFCLYIPTLFIVFVVILLSININIVIKSKSK